MMLPTVPVAAEVFDRCASDAEPETATAPDAVLLLACWLDAPEPAIPIEPEADDALPA
jgi:hypothetical protein